MRIIIGIISFLFSFLNGVLFSDLSNIHTKKYNIYTKKVKKDSRIVFITDLHGKKFGEDNKILLEKIDKENPDVVLIGGDIITTKFAYNINTMISLVGNLSSKYKVYYAIGNHESRLKWDEGRYPISYNQLIEIIEENGAKVLDNSSAVLDDLGINLYGLTLNSTFYRKNYQFTLSSSLINRCLSKKDNDYYNLLLAHNPEYCDVYSKNGFDAVLSGHMHGGVMRLPKGFGFISPRFKLFKPYCWGAFKLNGTVNIISAGLSMHSVPIRLFNPSELTVINFKHKISMKENKYITLK